MEAVKARILSSIASSIGPCTVDFETKEQCMIICVKAFPRHLIFVQPDRLEKSFLCHYAHRMDLETTAHASAEVREWMVQSKLQLVRQYKGKPSDFVKIATTYATAAVERMDMWKGIDDGRRVMPVQQKFNEAKKRERFFPRPNSPTSMVDKDSEPCSANKRPKTSSDPVYQWKPKRA